MKPLPVGVCIVHLILSHDAVESQYYYDLTVYAITFVVVYMLLYWNLIV